MSEPLTQAMFLEVVEQINARITEGHGRVREGLNELKAEMRAIMERTARRCEDHSGRLLIMETKTAADREAAHTRKQDTRDRNVLVASLTSILVTVVIFIVKSLLKL